MMLVNGKPFRNIAEQFGTSVSALTRHKAEHIPAAMAQAKSAAEVAQADGLVHQLVRLQADARRIEEKAEETGDLRVALMGIRELVRIVELTAKLIGELDDRPQVNVLLAPEWTAVRVALLAALQPFPEARFAVAQRLASLEAAG
jgi:hypothetical protein